MARGLSDFCIVTDSQDFTYVVDMRKKSKVNLPTGEVEVAQLAELGPGGSFTVNERELDAFFLDVKAPWDGIPVVKQALRNGGHLGVLVPTGNQVSGTIRSLDDHGL